MMCNVVAAIAYPWTELYGYGRPPPWKPIKALVLPSLDQPRAGWTARRPAWRVDRGPRKLILEQNSL